MLAVRWRKPLALIVPVLLFSASAAYAVVDTIEAGRQRCGKAAEDEPVIRQSDFRWGYTADEMRQRFNEIYVSGKRLPGRAYYDEANGEFVLSHYSSLAAGSLRLTEDFIRGVARQIENSLASGFAEYVFFPDMGHSHLYFPEQYWQETFVPVPEVNDFARLYEKMFADKNIKILYHTAEQLMMVDEQSHLLPDSHLQFRYWNRNVMGDMLGNLEIFIHQEKKRFNTVGELPGYKRWGGGFNISASENGCFAYKSGNETLYFDISIKEFDL